MPLVPLKFRPTVVKDDSEYEAETAFIDSQWYRFWRGKPETIGGYQRAAGETCEGVCRGLSHWVDSGGTQHFVVGTNKKLYSFSGGTQINITPAEEIEGTLTDALRTTSGSATVTITHTSHGLITGDTIYLHASDLVGGILVRGAFVVTVISDTQYTVQSLLTATTSEASGGGTITYYYPRQTLQNIFTTTAGSTTVTVTHVSHGRGVGDRVFFSNASPLGGITISGEYAVTSLIDSDNYTIEVTIAPNISDTGGGDVSTLYEISIGRAEGVGGFGYGTGTYGTGSYGTSQGLLSDIIPRTWSLSRYGDDLIACPFGGKIYKWNREGRAVRLYGAPVNNNVVIVSNERIIVSGGTVNASNEFDPMLVRWNHTEQEYNWDLTDETLTTGDFPLNNGSQIICLTETDREILVFTDEGLYSMQFNVSTVYGILYVAAECGIMGPNSIASFGKGVIWASNRNVFFFYDGGPVNRVECPIQKFIFDAIPENQGAKMYGGTITEFGEVWFLYETNTEKRYATYSQPDSWATGTLDRTAIIDAGSAPRPIMAGEDDYIYFHETGTTDADGNAIPAHIETGDFDIAEGDQIAYASRLILDYHSLTNSAISIILKAKKYPTSTEVTKTYTVTPSTDRIDCRIRGRHLSVRQESTTNGFCRWGKPRINVSTDGAN